MEWLLIARHGGSLVGIDLALVGEVVRMLRPLPLPGAPSGVMGVMDLRGEIIPILDLETRLPCGAGDPGIDHHLVVIELAKSRMAVAVSHVEEIAKLVHGAFRSGKQVLPEGVPLLGVAHTDAGLVPVLDPAGLMRKGEVMALKKALRKLSEATA